SDPSTCATIITRMKSSANAARRSLNCARGNARRLTAEAAAGTTDAGPEASNADGVPSNADAAPAKAGGGLSIVAKAAGCGSIGPDGPGPVTGGGSVTGTGRGGRGFSRR